MAGDWTDRYPDAVFDLHGQTVLEAATNAQRFLRAQAARPGGVVRLITGAGPRRRRCADPDPGADACSATEREAGAWWRTTSLEDSEGSYLVRLRLRVSGPAAGVTAPARRARGRPPGSPSHLLPSPSMRQVSRSIRPRRTHCIIRCVPCTVASTRP